MPYSVPSFDSIRADLLRDIKSLRPDADVGVDSDYFVRATSVASAVEGLYEHQAWLVKQLFPDTADSEFLARHAQVRGLRKKRAVAAAGSIAMSGVPGSPIASGLAFKVGEFVGVTTASGVVDAGGKATIAASAQVAGIAGNLIAGASGSLSAPPLGVASGITVVSMIGGVDEETDAELLARLLDLIRRPPAGGNRYDYRRWAMEVAGVSAAYVYPLRRGLGTVDIAITSAGEMPSGVTIAAVQAHIEDARPVTGKNSLVIAPTPRIVNVDALVSLNGLSLVDAKAQITTGQASYFNQMEPGETAFRSRIETLISSLSGVVDRQVNLPAANIVPVVDATKVEWLRLGTVNVGAMA